MSKSQDLENGLILMKENLSILGPIDEKDWANFSSIWKVTEAGRKINLTSPGQVEQYIYFVLGGVQRVYALDKSDREATIVLTYTGDFGGVLDSSLLGIPSSYYFETLSKSKFLRCTHEDFYRVVHNSIALRKLIDTLIHGALSGMMKRLVELQTHTSEEKFKTLLTRSPHILNLIPHKYLANYIGIDPTNFSKLVNRIKI